MDLIHEMEMQRTEQEAAVSSSDDSKIVADAADGSSLVVRTSTGVRISAQLDDDGIIGSNGSKSDPSGAMPVKDKVTGDESVTLCDEKDIVELETYRAASLEFRVKEEPDLDFENQVSNQEEEMVVDTIDKHVVSLAQKDEMIVDSIAESVVEVVSRGSYKECVSVKVKDEPENLEIEQSIPTAVILASKPLQILLPKPENFDTPEVIDVESDSMNSLIKQERSDTHEQISSAPVKTEVVEETNVGALSLSLQVKEQKPVYVKKAHTQVDARKVKVEDGDFPVEKDWYLVGRSLVTATSTSKGRRLEDNEIVNFAFPSTVNWKVPNIVRFSTKRCGEIGRLPMEWSKLGCEPFEIW